MNIFKNLAIVQRVIDNNSVSVLVVGEEHSPQKILKASSFYIAGLKELLEQEESVLINFNPENNTIIEEGEN